CARGFCIWTGYCDHYDGFDSW
nr:immunoglobulin heavy chain junction region [Macaca mulatta]MOV89172.1 immunoglobulin heavy chain junction region [Macaca mulatta]MOV90393.1 immunoglobulin heavy chain junction region [Macaca mulatta]MOV90664.1 immunoglobulin heavy chain junction region [Macaca mulatta]